MKESKEYVCELWVCGQLKGSYDERGSVWEFQGVFQNEQRAIDACKNENYFIFPVELDKEFPDKSVFLPRTYYPKI